MRKAALVATALIAVLALSVGALAYPVVVGTHPLSAVHSGFPTAVNRPNTDGNSTGNETNDNETVPIPPMPESNDTEMGNIFVDHNVTMAREDNTTRVNGTLTIVQANVTLVDLTFQIVVHDNGTTNITFNGTERSARC